MYLKDLYALRVKITEEKRHPGIFSPNKKELGITCGLFHLRACFCHTQLGINSPTTTKTCIAYSFCYYKVCGSKHFHSKLDSIKAFLLPVLLNTVTTSTPIT